MLRIKNSFIFFTYIFLMKQFQPSFLQKTLVPGVRSFWNEFLPNAYAVFYYTNSMVNNVQRVLKIFILILYIYVVLIKLQFMVFRYSTAIMINNKIILYIYVYVTLRVHGVIINEHPSLHLMLRLRVYLTFEADIILFSNKFV